MPFPSKRPRRSATFFEPHPKSFAITHELSWSVAQPSPCGATKVLSVSGLDYPIHTSRGGDCVFIVNLEINGGCKAHFKFASQDGAWDFANALLARYKEPVEGEPHSIRAKICAAKRRITFTEPDKGHSAAIQVERIHPSRLTKFRRCRTSDWMTPAGGGALGGAAAGCLTSAHPFSPRYKPSRRLSDRPRVHHVTRKLSFGKHAPHGSDITEPVLSAVQQLQHDSRL